MSTPFSHSIFMCSPSDFILGLPFTVAMMSQTFVKAFRSHVFFKHAWRSCACSVAFTSCLIVFWSPSDMIPRCSSSNTIVDASTSAMNCCRKWSRNLAVWKGKKDCNTSTHMHAGVRCVCMQVYECLPTVYFTHTVLTCTCRFFLYPFHFDTSHDSVPLRSYACILRLKFKHSIIRKGINITRSSWMPNVTHTVAPSKDIAHWYLKSSVLPFFWTQEQNSWYST